MSREIIKKILEKIGKEIYTFEEVLRKFFFERFLPSLNEKERFDYEEGADDYNSFSEYYFRELKRNPKFSAFFFRWLKKYFWKFYNQRTRKAIYIPKNLNMKRIKELVDNHLLTTDDYKLLEELRKI